VRGAVPALVEVFASGLDVIEVRDDDDVLGHPGEGFLAGAELSWQ
jgi:hypothetical protein